MSAVDGELTNTQTWTSKVTCSLKLIRSLNGRRWLVTDVMHEQQRLIAHKMRSNTD